jgi:metallo-beta-lactamase class B
MRLLASFRDDRRARITTAWKGWTMRRVLVMRVVRLAATVLAGLVVAVTSINASAQSSFARRDVTNDAWTRPFPAVRIAGNLYYVGTWDLASFLIATDEGHMLVNTGVYDSIDAIRANVESLGFEFADIEILLTTQAHWDHVADLAAIKRQTGARLYAHEGDVATLEDGGISDFRFPDRREAIFEPVQVDRVLQDGDTIELGGTVVTLHHHPGHTKGASSFSFLTEEGGRERSVLIVNMGTINAGVELLNMPGYPAIADDYAATFRDQLALEPDVWVSSHAGHFDLHDRFKPGDTYDPNRFADPAGYRAKIELFEQRYREQLEAERARR